MLQASKFPFPSQYRLQANISRDIVLPQGKQALVQTARAGRASANEPGPHYSLHYFRLRAWQFDLIFILNSISINQYSLVYNCRHQGQNQGKRAPLSSGTFTWEKKKIRTRRRAWLVGVPARARGEDLVAVGVPARARGDLEGGVCVRHGRADRRKRSFF